MKILLAGDSTVANARTQEYPMSGWGAELAPLVHGWGAVHNFAKGGASTESFREEGLWEQLLDLATEGDLVLLQFGHNDQKQQHLAASTGYTANLLRMVDEIRGKGAVPVICTSVERRNFIAGCQTATLLEYAEAAKSLAEREGLACIDLEAWTTRLYGEAGEEGSKAYFTFLAVGENAHWPDGLADNTHFNRCGATVVAAQVAGQLAALAARAVPTQ
ncbi:MAG: rhamnogalacturonan acetylesterase [Acidobacteria bacterium]|nr:rhamnogalacturonan acetylesterase [Acidobacteriota bacterium]